MRMNATRATPPLDMVRHKGRNQRARRNAVGDDAVGP
jgi:hypothetical protein